MKYRLLKIIICKIKGHRWIYSPKFCQRCHFDGQFYPVKYIKHKGYLIDTGRNDLNIYGIDKVEKYKYI